MCLSCKAYVCKGHSGLKGGGGENKHILRCYVLCQHLGQAKFMLRCEIISDGAIYCISTSQPGSALGSSCVRHLWTGAGTRELPASFSASC